MPKFYLWVWIVVFFGTLLPSLRAEEQASPEDLKAMRKQWDQGKTFRGQEEFINLDIITSAYTQENQGRYPRSWADLERQFGENVWASKKEWEDLQRRVVFLPYIEGKITVPNEGPSLYKMVMVYAEPYDQKRETSRSLGRWVLWFTSRGTFVARWHGEGEIQGFTAWPQVQKLIDEAKITQNASASPSHDNSGDLKPSPIGQPVVNPQNQSNPSDGQAEHPSKVESAPTVQPEGIETGPHWWLILSAFIGIIAAGFMVFLVMRDKPPKR